MACSSGALYPGVPAVPLARGAETPLFSIVVDRDARVPTVPLDTTAPRPGGGGGTAPPRPLWSKT